MMLQQVLTLLGFLLFTITYSNSIGIDDKLDFGTSGSHPSFRSQDSVHRSPHLPVSYKSTVTKIGINDNLDDAGIVCSSGGCNRTSSEDTLKTDVVVRIETKIDLNQNTSGKVDDTPDVPVVVGFNSEPDETNDEKSRQSHQPIYPGYGSSSVGYGSGSQGYGSGSPVYGLGSPLYGLGSSGYGSGSPGYASSGSSGLSLIPSMSVYGQGYSSNDQLFYPSTGNYGGSGNSQNRRIDYGISHDFNSPERNDGVNIKIKTLPPVAIDIADNTQNNFLEGMELTVPYFDPSHHMHHFGEIPPPQHAWYPKKTNSFNPVEFRTTKPSVWMPSVWYKTVAPHRHTNTPVGQEVKCVCQNNGQAQPGLRWYPNENRRVSEGNVGQFGNRGDPGSQINDKLAPLN